MPQGDSITITLVDDELYIDTGKVIMRDYLTTNGVLKVLDSPLNSNTMNHWPALAPSPGAEASRSGGLSAGGEAGITIVVVVLVVGLIIGWFWVQRRKRRRTGTLIKPLHELTTNLGLRVNPKYEIDGKESRTEAVELGPSVERAELAPPVVPAELGWNDKTRLSKHIGFQAKNW